MDRDFWDINLISILLFPTPNFANSPFADDRKLGIAKIEASFSDLLFIPNRKQIRNLQQVCTRVQVYFPSFLVFDFFCVFGLNFNAAVERLVSVIPIYFGESLAVSVWATRMQVVIA